MMIRGDTAGICNFTQVKFWPLVLDPWPLPSHREPVPVHVAALHEPVPDERLRHGAEGGGRDYPGLRQRQDVPRARLRSKAAPRRTRFTWVPPGNRLLRVCTHTHTHTHTSSPWQPFTAYMHTHTHTHTNTHKFPLVTCLQAHTHMHMLACKCNLHTHIQCSP